MTKRDPVYVAAFCLLIAFMAAANCHAGSSDPENPNAAPPPSFFLFSSSPARRAEGLPKAERGERFAVILGP